METILSVSGKPGLYKLVSRGKMNLIVETIDAAHRDYFAEVLPSYDRDRVHDSDIKKLLQWYNILVENGYTDFKALLSMEEEEATEADSKASEEQEAK